MIMDVIYQEEEITVTNVVIKLSNNMYTKMTRIYENEFDLNILDNIPLQKLMPMIAWNMEHLPQNDVGVIELSKLIFNIYNTRHINTIRLEL